MPSINVVILDGEEYGGYGSQHLSERINAGDFGEVKWVLNLELTGIGGERFFLGDYPGPLTDHIQSMFDCPIVRTPFNDSVIFRKNGNWEEHSIRWIQQYLGRTQSFLTQNTWIGNSAKWERTNS